MAEPPDFRMRFSLLGDTVVRRIRIIGLFCVLCAGGILPAHAYVLDAAQILDKTVKAIGSTGAAVIQQSLILHAAAGDGDAPRIAETVRYLFPGRFRSDIQSENVHKIQAVSFGDRVTVINEQLPAEGEEWFDRYKDLMLYRTAAPLEALLSEAGVDTTVSSFGRFDGRQAFIIGAHYPDESVPQLWVDKTTFVPFRWIVSGRDPVTARDLREIRYQGWHKSGGVWYPMRIAFFVNEALAREIQIDGIQFQPTLPEDQFDVSRLRMSVQPRITVPVETDGGGAEEVHRTIEDFKQIYER